ncbi:PepSY1/2 domain-containing protein [Paenisporosarcina sp. TG-14]|uniref:PepSY1/2 domain-containing protein n=1 Tax=Paenisporosarcina sp. TG-14 TaxID=1231057 RepID=UPI0002EF6334|nr:PepSY1/2 domain-containing protein [Paenisporosarcina sp. TG-14]
MKILSSVLTVVLIIMGVFLYTSKQNEKDLALDLRAQYTNRLSDSSEKLSELQKAVQSSTVFKDKAAQAQPLEDIWRLTSEIRSDIASLPLQREFSNEWMNYLGRLGDYAKLKGQEKVTDDKWLVVTTNVAANLDEFSYEWQNATTELLAKQQSFSKWQKEVKTAQPSKQWSGMTKQVKGYSEADFPLTASESDDQKKKDLQAIDEKPKTEQEVVSNMKEMFPKFTKAKIVTSTSKSEAPYPFYHIQFHEGIRTGYADFTKKGGHLLSLLVERPIGEDRISQEKMKEKANEAVKSFGFDDLELVETRENHLVWHVVFVRLDPVNDARIYSDAIQLKLAKDDGEILGVNTMEYIQKEKLPDQKIVAIDWNTFFTSEAKVQQERLAYTENNQLQQRLCYELLVLKQTDDQSHTFRILVDTETKEVLKSELLT